MRIDEKIRCPICEGIHFQVKREATYVYSYNIETPLTDNWSKEYDEALPFLFDDRELKSSIEYAECKSCKTRFLCDLDNGSSNSKIHFTIIQKAIRSDLVKEPEFFG